MDGQSIYYKLYGCLSGGYVMLCFQCSVLNFGIRSGVAQILSAVAFVDGIIFPHSCIHLSSMNRRLYIFFLSFHPHINIKIV